MVACGKFYKVDSLTVATRISHNYQVLLDDGNRIIIPQGNFKKRSKCQAKLKKTLFTLTIILSLSILALHNLWTAFNGCIFKKT